MGGARATVGVFTGRTGEGGSFLGWVETHAWITADVNAFAISGFFKSDSNAGRADIEVGLAVRTI